MFAIIRTRWQTRPLSRRAKRRSSAAPGSPRKKYAGILHPPNMVRLLINSTTSGDHRKPVLLLVRKEPRRRQRADERLFGRLCRDIRRSGGGALDSRQLARDLRRVLTLHHRAHAGGRRET